MNFTDTVFLGCKRLGFGLLKVQITLNNFSECKRRFSLMHYVDHVWKRFTALLVAIILSFVHRSLDVAAPTAFASGDNWFRMGSSRPSGLEISQSEFYIFWEAVDPAMHVIPS
jgi:hypothetical protein